MKFPLRFTIALAILAGRRTGKYGPRTMCETFVMDSGEPAWHQDNWELSLLAGTSTCRGTKWARPTFRRD